MSLSGAEIKHKLLDYLDNKEDSDEKNNLFKIINNDNGFNIDTMTIDDPIYKKYMTILSRMKMKIVTEGGRRREMNLKDIKEICKANQIKLSRVVDGKRVVYKKKELMTKLKRKKLL
jgi:hypothetical protein